MQPLTLKHIEKTLVRQHNQSWCGLACLASIVKYFGGNIPQEKLQAQSGTSLTGTTLLGLYQAANNIGLAAEGFEAEIENLQEITAPAILHVTLDDGLEHYVVCYGHSPSGFVIGDPAKGIAIMTEKDVEHFWKSKKLLLVEKGEKFQTTSDVAKHKQAWLKSLLKPDISILSIIAVLGMVVSVAGISLAIFSQKLIDQILPAKDFQKLWVGVIVLGLLLLAKNGLGYLRGVLVARQSKDFSNRIVGSFYNLILYLPKSFFDSLKTGEITARLNDASRIQRTINYASGTLLVDILTVVICTVLLFNYWWASGVVTLIGALLFALIFMEYSKKIIAGQRSVMMSYAGAESNFFDTVQGVEVIKSNNKEDFFTNYTKHIYATFQTSIYDLALLGNRVGFRVENVGTLAILGVIVFSSFAVLHDVLSLGALVAVLSLSASVINSSASLSGAYITLQEAKVAYDRLYEFVSMDKESDEVVPRKETETIETLQVKNIRFRFPGRPLLLNDVNFTAHKGKLTAILGEIGCGKSTLLQILQRFYDVEAGEIVMDDIPWKSFPLNDWRERIGVMPQHIKLFNASLIENICLTNDEENIKRCLDFCEQLGIGIYFNNLPLGTLTRVGEDGINLSGGQRQLVGLCRALYKNPAILLLDEPTNNMDKSTIQFVWNLLEREKHQRICVLVTHNEVLAAKAELVINL